MVRSTLQSELDNFFGLLNGDAEGLLSEITKSAYCEARKKFSATAFIELNQQVVHEYYHEAVFQRWCGHRVLMVDGSTIELPFSENLLNHYGKVNSSARHPGARLSELYDPLNDMTLDVQVSPCHVGERELAIRHLEAACSGDLILYDRGYPAAWLIALHQAKGIHCCMRSPWNLYNETRDFLTSGQDEQIVELSMSDGSRAQAQALGLSEEPIRVRLIHVDLPDSDEQEVLITTLLDENSYPASDFKWLYHQRWTGEENYKTLKSRLEIENFSGYSATVIEQDIHSKVLTKNIAALLANEAQTLVDSEEKRRQRSVPYKVDFANVLRKLKDNLVRLFIDPSPAGLIERLLSAFAREAEPVRPGRSSDRMIKRGTRFNMNYKRC